MPNMNKIAYFKITQTNLRTKKNVFAKKFSCICVAISKIRGAENPWIFSAPCFSFWVLLRKLAIGAGPVLCGFQEGGVAVGADVLQRLFVLAIFVAEVVEEGLDDLAGLVLPAVPAGDVAFGQAAFLHPALCPAQVPGAVQVSRFAALAGLLILPAGPAAGAAAADLLRAVHRGAPPSKWQISRKSRMLASTA